MKTFRHWLFLPTLLASTAFYAPASHAAAELLAVGTLTNPFDLSTATSGALENGVAGNTLGGIGSGLAWAGGSTFLALPDRGPNANSYNALVEDTTSYISRFQTVNLALTPVANGNLAFTLTPTLTATTLLSSQTPLVYGTGALGTGGTNTLGSGIPALNATNNTNYFTGRSDGFAFSGTTVVGGKTLYLGNSGNPNKARLDPEAIRVSNGTNSVFVSDEYGPYVYEFNRSTGQRVRTFTLPSNLDITKLSPVGATEISGNTVGRVTNKGMEGLAITPDGTTLVGIMQAALEQDGGKAIRIVTIDIASGTTHEYAYKLTTGSGVSEILAINNHEFLVDERDGNGLATNGALAGNAAVVKQLFRIDLNGATDVTGLSGAASLNAVAVNKTLVLDVVSALGAKGIAADHIPSKLEGLAFGADIIVNGQIEHTLYLANDNDFLAATKLPDGTDIANPNTFYVFGLTNTDLGATFTQQDIPEPLTLGLFGLGLAGLGLSRRRAQ